MNVILALESRLITVHDVPSMAPFFFVDPDLTSEEARSMIESFTALDRRNTLEAVLRHVEPSSTEDSWDHLDINDMLHNENIRLGLKSKIFMTVLRHALTGMKKGPGVPKIMQVLGSQRTVARLKMAHAATVIV